MIIIFSDKTTLEIGSIFTTDDGNNLTISLTGDFASTKEIFKNAEKISTISTDNTEYCRYTILKSIQAVYDGALDTTEILVELEYNGLSSEVDKLKSEIEILQSGILELTDLLLEKEENQ